MPAVPCPRTPPPDRAPAWLRPPPGRWMIAVGMGLVALIVGLRVCTAVMLPTFLWTRDSGSYVAPAVAWLDTGSWVTSARRGPVYSLFLAGIFRAGGTLATVATAQAVIGACTAVLTLLMAWTWLGRRGFWPWALCGFFYAVYGMPLEIERLIRNETLLTFFATLAFGGWFFALRTGSAKCFAVSGLASGLMQLLKGIFPIFPLLVLGLAAWNWRRQPARWARLALCYAVPFLLPLVASKGYDRLSGTGRASEPEAGEMFYGRTAQWTVLDGGIEPEIKARIRDQAAAYADHFRRTGKLDNNEIVKRTVVPSLKAIVIDERHGRPADVDRLCWRLGIEAAAHHPGAYLRQAAHDFYLLNFITAHRFILFFTLQLQEAARDSGLYVASRPPESRGTYARLFDLSRSVPAVQHAAEDRSGLDRFSRFLTSLGRLRLVSPVFLTTLCLPLLGCFTRGRERLFWVGNAILWAYYLVLLSTVGRPLDRYLMPVLPIMFWTISTALTLGLEWARRKYATRTGRPHHQSPAGAGTVGAGVS